MEILLNTEDVCRDVENSKIVAKTQTIIFKLHYTRLSINKIWGWIIYVQFYYLFVRFKDKTVCDDKKNIIRYKWKSEIFTRLQILLFLQNSIKCILYNIL